MISVLIPVYNYNISTLVTEIYKQLVSVNEEFEIICIDDCSSNPFFDSSNIKLLDKVEFIKLNKNIGRSKIRNLLAEKARFDWLLFLDADVLPKSFNFINTYMNHIKQGEIQVYCGGIIYENDKPINSKMLRWVYGKKREEIDVEIRKLNPYRYFLGANFLIPKTIFNSIKFNDDILKYGYEDVVFIEELRIKNIVVKQINNVVFHMGIEESQEFLAKTKEALENLKLLRCQNIVDGKYIKILRTYNKVKFYRLDQVFSILYLIFSKMFEYNLKSNRPSIFIFDLYKLTYFCFINGYIKAKLF